MTTIAKVLCKSIGYTDSHKPVTSFELYYPRLIHAEELTHRLLETQPTLVLYEPDGLMYDQDLSRNASSSRAIPVPRMIRMIEDDPVIPLWWGKHQAGMQAREQLTGDALERVKNLWIQHREESLYFAGQMHAAGAHKQLINRILEPHGHIKVVVTATEWNNFFALRRHADADPEIQALAEAMWIANEEADCKVLQKDQWHLPYILPQDWDRAHAYLKAHRWTGDVPSDREVLAVLKRVSAARCARTSYMNHEGKETDFEEDKILFDRLTDRAPVHASPLEHQCTPDRPSYDYGYKWDNPNRHGNLEGYIQFRKQIADESVPG